MNQLKRKRSKRDGFCESPLFIFVAVPFPGTGAWTGALIAALMNMRLKDALPSITLGVCTAGVIVTALSILVPNLLGF